MTDALLLTEPQHVVHEPLVTTYTNGSPMVYAIEEREIFVDYDEPFEHIVGKHVFLSAHPYIKPMDFSPVESGVQSLRATTFEITRAVSDEELRAYLGSVGHRLSGFYETLSYLMQAPKILPREKSLLSLGRGVNVAGHRGYPEIRRDRSNRKRLDLHYHEGNSWSIGVLVSTISRR